MDRAAYDAEWARTHGGVDPASSRLIGGWVRLVARVARPLAQIGVPPDAVTVAAVVVAGAAAATAGESRWRAGVVAVLVLLSALLDGIDGAVALLRRQTTAWGFVVDSVADRLADGLVLAAIWRMGAAPGVVIAAAAALTLLEYTRARAGAAGMHDVGVVSVGERPTRLILAVMTALTAAVVGDVSPIATAGAGAVVAVSSVGWVQVLVVVRRALVGRQAADAPD